VGFLFFRSKSLNDFQFFEMIGYLWTHNRFKAIRQWLYQGNYQVMKRNWDVLMQKIKLRLRQRTQQLLV
jgi:hypothetical protein